MEGKLTDLWDRRSRDKRSPEFLCQGSNVDRDQNHKMGTREGLVAILFSALKNSHNFGLLPGLCRLCCLREEIPIQLHSGKLSVGIALTRSPINAELSKRLSNCAKQVHVISVDLRLGFESVCLVRMAHSFL